MGRRTTARPLSARKGLPPPPQRDHPLVPLPLRSLPPPPPLRSDSTAPRLDLGPLPHSLSLHPPRPYPYPVRRTARPPSPCLSSSLAVQASPRAPGPAALLVDAFASPSFLPSPCPPSPLALEPPLLASPSSPLLFSSSPGRCATSFRTPFVMPTQSSVQGRKTPHGP